MLHGEKLVNLRSNKLMKETSKVTERKYLLVIICNTQNRSPPPSSQ
jgi:hypothetical protein